MRPCRSASRQCCHRHLCRHQRSSRCAFTSAVAAPQHVPHRQPRKCNSTAALCIVQHSSMSARLQQHRQQLQHSVHSAPALLHVYDAIAPPLLPPRNSHSLTDVATPSTRRVASGSASAPGAPLAHVPRCHHASHASAGRAIPRHAITIAIGGIAIASPAPIAGTRSCLALPSPPHSQYELVSNSNSHSATISTSTPTTAQASAPIRGSASAASAHHRP